VYPIIIPSADAGGDLSDIEDRSSDIEEIDYFPPTDSSAVRPPVAAEGGALVAESWQPAPGTWPLVVAGAGTGTGTGTTGPAAWGGGSPVRRPAAVAGLRGSARGVVGSRRPTRPLRGGGGGISQPSVVSTDNFLSFFICKGRN
jgi:hypothetical protein